MLPTMPRMQRRARPAVLLRFPLLLLLLVACATVPLAARGSAQSSGKLDEIRKKQSETTTEIQAAERELRYFDAASPAVSGRRRGRG